MQPRKVRMQAWPDRSQKSVQAKWRERACRFYAKVLQRRRHRIAAKQPVRAQACATAMRAHEHATPRACVGTATQAIVAILASGTLWADAPVQAFWQSSGLRHLRRNRRLKDCRKIATGICTGSKGAVPIATYL
jgi:hypothetical protein